MSSDITGSPPAETSTGMMEGPPAGVDGAPEHKPYVPDRVQMPEFTLPSVLVGALLGIVFGASSLYLLLKVGMTVSASVPIAVLSITLFRVFSLRTTSCRRPAPPANRSPLASA
jgi:hypothetical protein